MLPLKAIFQSLDGKYFQLYMQNQQGSRTVLRSLRPEFRASWKSHYWVGIHESYHENDWCFYYVYKKNKDTEFLPSVSPSSTKGVGVKKLVRIFFKIFDFFLYINCR